MCILNGSGKGTERGKGRGLKGAGGTREGNGTVWHGSRREDDVGEARKAARCREVREMLVREAKGTGVTMCVCGNVTVKPISLYTNKKINNNKKGLTYR